MSKTEFTYVKAAAAKSGTFIRASLWFGEDHLLSVRNQRFREEYSRYYYSDIQAIELRRAARFGFPGWMWAVVGLLSILWPVVSLSNRNVPFYAMPTLLLGILLWFLYTAIFRSCVCHVITKIGVEELPALQRIGPSTKAMEELRTRVLQVQQDLPREWEDAYEALPARRLSESSRARGNNSGLLHTGSLRGGSFWAAAALFFVAADAFITSIQIGFINLAIPKWLGNLNLLFLIVAGVAAFLVLRAKEARRLRSMALICVLFVGTVSYGSEFLGNITQAFGKLDRNAPLAIGLQSLNSVLGLVNIGGDLVLLVVGVVILLRTLRQAEPGTLI